MANNKVQLSDGTTLIDLTQDTVTPQTLLSGATAHNAAGEKISGSVVTAPASTTTPKAPGTANAGSENAYARGDHVHPKEVSNADRAAWDGKAAKALSFTVTLTGSGWESNVQTVSNSNFAVSGYAYTVCPASGSREAYAQAVIYADDVTVAGKMTFHCSSSPVNSLTVNILSVEVEE